MRFKILLLGAALCFAVSPSRAGIPVIDPTNLIQNTVTAVKGVTTATNMVKSFNETVKIYQQAKKYYDALKKVHNLVKDAR
jgi:P-type conjugative transfer protein TrbJ